uniref:SFRICE_028323 n=1 Tax=Spodoptera frugiperda TaxID=7108 RepID=A0A2H1WLI6_SPOFR
MSGLVVTLSSSEDEDVTPSTSKQKQDILFDYLDVIPENVKDSVISREHILSDVGSTTKSLTQQEKKKTKALEKEAKKRKLQEDKKDRAARIEMNKVYKPGECMQYINVVINENLLRKWYMTSVEQEVTAAGANIERQSEERDIITWTRRLPLTLDKYFGKLKKPNEEQCDHALCIMEVDRVTRLVQDNALARTMIEFKERLQSKLTLVVVQVEAYFKSKSGQKDMNAIVTADCDVVTVETAQELAETIVRFTKAIADAPAKKAKREIDELSSFYMRGVNKNCVAITNNGAGVSQLWQQMLAVLPQSSLDISRAVCAQYKSPLAMYESLQEPDSLEHLSNLGVSRSGVAGAKQRKLGREFALKLHTLFTATSGDVIVGEQTDE